MFDLGGDRVRPRKLRIVSALAEGADQWVVEVADGLTDVKYDLQCPLPFSREEYEKDFADPTNFRKLLKGASAVLELDGERNPSSLAYEAVGRAVLNQSDLLLAVWDGEREQGKGGTGAVVEEALQRGIPVVWVAWQDKNSTRLPDWQIKTRAGNFKADAWKLRFIVRDLLQPPQEETSTWEHNQETTKREQYFDETQKKFNLLHPWWQFFSGIVSGEIFSRKNVKTLLFLPAFFVQNFEEATRTQWVRECRNTILDPDPTNQKTRALASTVDDSYFRHYAWANGLSVYYANLYRGAFVVSYLLAAVAVFLALFGWAGGFPHEQHRIWVGLEFTFIVTILVVTTWGRHMQWHERSIDYRMLAERLRLARCLALFGGGGQQVSMAAHLATYGNPTATWMHWHYQAIERAAGLVNARFTSDYLQATKDFWCKNLIEDQIEYHSNASRRYQKLDENVHDVSFLLFVITLIACGMHLLLPVEESFAKGLILTAACLPALVSALAGIRTQAEAQRLFRRSLAMKENLKKLNGEFASSPARDDKGDSQPLRAGADRITELMVKEMLDWRVVVEDRPLETT